MYLGIQPTVGSISLHSKKLYKSIHCVSELKYVLVDYVHFLIVVPELKVLRESYVKLINGLKVQGDNLFQHFISVGIFTLEDYNDFDEKPGTKRSKAKWFVD